MRLRDILASALISSAAISAGVGGIATVATAPGCESDDDDKKVCALKPEDATLDQAVLCAQSAFSAASANITNRFLPFGNAAGRAWVLEGEEDGETVRVEVTVAGTDTVAGVTVRVVSAKEFVNGVKVEDTIDWYAQADNGTVCYLGEDVTNILADGSTNKDGTWAVDFVTNLPGIIMPADPKVGDIFIQEVAPGIAEDMSEMTGTGETVVTVLGTHTDTITGDDCNPLNREPEDKKIYARDVGRVYDNGVILIQYTQ